MGGGIDHQPSDKVAYDGQKIHRYVGDEAGKCFAKGTKVRMWDGSVKNIEDIENGELSFSLRVATARVMIKPQQFAEACC